MVIVTPCPSKECVGFYSRFLEGTGAFTNSCPILECKGEFLQVRRNGSEGSVRYNSQDQLMGSTGAILVCISLGSSDYEPETKLILFSRARIEVNKRLKKLTD